MTLKSLAIAAIVVTALSPATALTASQDLKLPDFGDPSVQYFGADEERQLGAQVLSRLRRRGLIIDDVQLEEYLSSIGQRIAVHAERLAYPYHFYWIDAPSINAFAAPGGYVGVHAGLLLATRREDELAGVLAHETAHVSQRHIARAVADARQVSLPVIAAVIAGAALAAAGNGQAGRAAQAGAAALSAQRRIDFTRSNELEADRIGYQLLRAAKFDGNGMADFFARLQRAQTGAVAKIPEFLLTHPLPRDRIADAQARLASGTVGHSAAAVSVRTDSLAYRLAKERLRVLSTANTNELLRYYQQTSRTGAAKADQAVRYGYALSLQRAGRYTDAAAEITRLRRAASSELAYRILEAENAFASGDRRRAWTLFEAALKLYPDDFRLSLHYGRRLASNGDPKHALRMLQPFLKRRPSSIQLFESYAQAGQRAGRLALTHAALAEVSYLSGDLEGAVAQAKIGVKAADSSSYQRAQIQARLQQLQAEQRALQER